MNQPPNQFGPPASSQGNPTPQGFGPPPVSYGQPPHRSPPPKGGFGIGAIIAIVLGGGCLVVGLVGGIVVVAAAIYLSTSLPPDEVFISGPDSYVPLPYDPHEADRFNMPVLETTPVRGADPALVTIVEIGDFECPFCARSTETMSQLLAENPDLRHAFRHNPLTNHPNAHDAAVASVEAYNQNGDQGFWRIHDLLFANSRNLGNGQVRTLASQAGVDLQRFDAAVASRSHDAVIEADAAHAQMIGATGTPTFYVNGRLIRGAQAIGEFRTVVRDELTYARSAVAAGIPASRLYDRLMENARRSPPAPEPTPAPTPARPARDPEVVHRIPVLDSPSNGPADALVTIVVFSDFECPFCGRLVPTLAGLRERYGSDLRIVFKHNPLPFHNRATPAALAAIDVQRQLGDDGFWRMHDVLFESSQQMSDDQLAGYARQVGADPSQVRAAIRSQRGQATIARDHDLAVANGASGTPTCFINGSILTGAQPATAFQNRIDLELTRARARVAAGTPRAEVYNAIMATAQ